MIFFRSLKYYFAALITLAGLYATAARNQVWQNETGVWEDAAGKSPSKGRIFNNLGEAYHRNKLYSRAIESYMRAIALSPASSLDAYSNIGVIYIDMGENDKAIACFTQLLSIDANDTLSLANRGNAYLKKDNVRAAIDDYTRALLLAPNNPQLHVNRGDAFRRTGGSAAAQADFEAACSLGDAQGCRRLEEIHAPGSSS